MREIERIYIIGPIGSGKSTLARHLSDVTGLPWFELDNVSHRYRGKQRRRRTDEERDRLFAQLLERPRWIMEDIGRSVFSEAMEKADLLIVLDVGKPLCTTRIIRRWTAQKLRLAYSNYRPTVRMLHALLRWSNEYHRTWRQRLARLSAHRDKTVVLRTKKEIKRFAGQMEEMSGPDGE